MYIMRNTFLAVCRASEIRLTIAGRVGLRNRLEINMVKNVDIVMLNEFLKSSEQKKIFFNFNFKITRRIQRGNGIARNKCVN